MLFPIWNIVMGMVMFYQIREREFEVTDENVSLLEVSGASIVLLIVFAANIAFHLTWAMTFSTCMFYASSLIFLLLDNELFQDEVIGQPLIISSGCACNLEPYPFYLGSNMIWVANKPEAAS